MSIPIKEKKSLSTLRLGGNDLQESSVDWVFVAQGCVLFCHAVCACASDMDMDPLLPAKLRNFLDSHTHFNWEANLFTTWTWTPSLQNWDFGFLGDMLHNFQLKCQTLLLRDSMLGDILVVLSLKCCLCSSFPETGLFGEG